MQPTPNALGAAQPAPMSLSASKAVAIRPRKDGLSGFAAYQADHPGLTHDQLRIGYQLCGGLGMYRPDCPFSTDRALLLKLIKQTRDSLDFMLGIDTPLTAAAARGDPELVSAILAKGVAVNMPGGGVRQIDMALERTVFGLTLADHNNMPAFWGTQQGHLQTMHLLLEAGADPQAKIPPENPPLFDATRMHTPDAASKQVRFEAVQLLLEHGADPNAVGPRLFRNLAESHDDALLALFVKHGLAAGKTQRSGLLITAVQTRNPALIKMMLAKGADPNTRTPDSHAPVITQADAEGAMLLLKAGADPRPCWKGFVGGACGLPRVLTQPPLLRLMLARGANPNADNGYGSPLWHALQQEMRVCIVRFGTKPNCPDDTPQRSAAAIMLLKAGANPNQRTHGKLPLMLVKDSEHDVINLLLNKGARMERASPEGYPLGPVTMAMANKHPYLAGELLRRTRGRLGSREKWGLFVAARDGDIDLINALAKRGANLNATGAFGETALHYAAASGQTDTVKRLLALGAKPDARSNAVRFSRTQESLNPLVIAREALRFSLTPDVQKPYRAVNLQPLALYDGHITPLMLAVAAHDMQTAEALLKGGARPTAKSQHGFTVLDWARAMRRPDMVRLLERYK